MLIAILIALGLLAAAALVYVHSLDDAAAQIALSEQGLFEELSLVFWLLLAAYILWRWRPGNVSAYCLSAAALIAAAREASLHKVFFDTSMMKIKFYTDAQIPLPHKLLVGSLVIAALVVLIYSLWLLIDWLRNDGWRQESCRIMVLGVGLLIGTKILDRMKSVLRADFNIYLSPLFAENVVILEESLEMALPLVLLIAARRLKSEQQKRRTA